MARKNLSRRDALKGIGTVMASALVVACAPQTVEVVKEVVKEVEVKVEVEKIVEVTAVPVKGVTNAIGMEFPADALPIEEQYMPIAVGTTGGGFGHIMESLYNRAFEHAGGQETLTTLDIDGNVIGIGAESWTQSEDGLSWDFMLRKELVWNDGSPVVAGDWEYTLKYSLGKGYDFGWFYSDIVGVQDALAGTGGTDDIGIVAVDDYTLRITTKAITPYVPALGVWFQVAKKDIWKTAGENWALDPKKYIASGPFNLAEFNRGIKNLWVLNETYKGVRRPYFTEIREETLPTAGGLPAYISGDIRSYGINGDTPQAEIALINSNPVLRAESHPTPSTFTDYLGFNTMAGVQPPFDNPDVRLALCKAIDKEVLIGEIYRGFSNTGWGVLPKGFPGYSGDKLKELDPNKYDPEAAKQLLSKAGFTDGKGFPKVEVWMRSPGPTNLNVMQAIQARWKENLGIEVELKPADFQAFAEVYQGKGEKAGIYYVSYSMDYFDPATFLNVFVTKGGRHPHVDPAWDEKYAKANANIDPVKRLEAIAACEADLVNSTAYFFMAQPFSISLVPCTLAGPAAQPNKDGYVFATGGGPGCPHAYEGLYWADPSCRASFG